MVGGKSCQLKFQPNKPATNGIALGKKPIQSPHPKKGKMMKRQLSKSTVGCVLSLIVLCGCAGTKPLPPSYWGAMARLSVDAAIWENPNERAKVALAARMLCDATQADSLAPVTFEQAINPENFSRETVAIIRGVQLI